MSTATNRARFDHRQLFEANPQPMWIYDQETLRFLAVNDATVARYGYSRDEFLTMSILDIRAPDAGQELVNYLATHTQGYDQAGVWYHRLKDGRVIPVEITAHSIDYNGRAARIVLGQDISARQEAETHQRRMAERMSHMLNASPTIIYVLRFVDGVPTTVSVSENAERMLGYAMAEVMAAGWWASHVHPDDRPHAMQALATLASVDALEHDYRFVRKDGKVIWIRDQLRLLRDAAGKPFEVAGAWTDITERKQAELDLARLNRALRMLSASSEALTRTDNETQLLRAVCRLAVDVGGYRMAWVGYAREDEASSIAPMAYAGEEDGYLSEIELSWAEDGPTPPGPAARCIQTGAPVVCEDIAHEPMFFWRDAASQRGYCGIVCLPLRNERRVFGLLALYSGEIRPIPADEIKLLTDLADNLAFGIGNLRAQHARQRMQAAMLKVAAGVSAGTGTAFFQQLARSMAEAVGAQAGVVARLLPPDMRTARTVAAVVGGRVIDEVEYHLEDAAWTTFAQADDRVVSVQLSSPLPWSSGMASGRQTVLGMALNSASGHAIGQLFVVFEGPHKPPGLIAPTLQIFAARAAAELERQNADASIREQASLLDKAHDAILVRGIDQRVRFWNKGAERLYGWSRDEAIGQTIDALIYADLDDLHRATAHVLESGEWNGQIRQRRKDGRALMVEGNWTLVRDEHGQPTSILCINTDITKRQQLEEQLNQSQRLEAVGQLTGGVAHDFNNLLTVILGNSELLTEELAHDEDLRTMAEMIVSAAQQGAQLTHRLLAFARRQALEPKVVKVNDLVSGMDGMLRRTLSEAIEIRFVQAESLWDAMVDPSQLEGALLNLCINARDAMPGGGRLTIETANATLDQDYIGEHADVAAGQYVLVAVSDTGTGIAPDHLGRVFEPFFTTKDAGKGTGLGLSMVFGFVKQSRGHIRIYSELGFGTTVRMYLPRTTAQAGEIAELRGVLTDFKGSETILLVEDNPLVRRYAEAQLIELGYHVVSVGDGPQALERLGQMGEVDLLFTDVVMPGGMNGRELADTARALRPGLKVLFTSGYTENAIVHHGRLDEGAQLLNKPYQRIELARKVRMVLSAS